MKEIIIFAWKRNPSIIKIVNLLEALTFILEFMENIAQWYNVA